MLIPITLNKFEKDLKLYKKSGKDLGKLRLVMSLLINEDKLPKRLNDHVLIGNYEGRRECHIEPDWLLIYHIKADAIIFERTGSHSDLFK
ncbi:MAG: type II toxin-antitoxin system YafQ family toxin [Gammaproteobacteria bacterium]|nr:type II toxin-antitoxin system YafQ family toxin [Gammaproteobacteria bacterium]